MMPLSNDLLLTIIFAAVLMSASAQIQAGALPGPTPMVGVPELYASFTMLLPPVARISDTSGWRMKRAVERDRRRR